VGITTCQRWPSLLMGIACLLVDRWIFIIIPSGY
jgi:hypothetical protein